MSSLEVLAFPAERIEVPQVSLGTWHTTGGSCRSRGSNASDHPLLCCGLCPCIFCTANCKSNDGNARWDGCVGSQECV